MSQAELDLALRDSLGCEKVLWLGDGLLNDHTDGHIDTIARFVAPGKVVAMAPASAQDPNKAVLEKIIADLSSFTDARGRKLEVVTVPSPGKVVNHEGKVLPASYLNFYIANRTVIVPTYGASNDRAAVAAIAKLFPNRQTVGLSAYAILSGGGAFHCITQQQPWGRE
jgi:agmatine deiminase